MISSNNKQRRRSPNSKHFSYEFLEERRVLASMVGLDAATGALNISLDANDDVAVVDIAESGLVTVNGDTDLDSSTSGTQTLDFADLRTITVEGSTGNTGQMTAFNGDFSTATGAALSSISVNEVQFVTFNGTYDLAATLDVSLDGTGGRVGDSTDGSVSVAGRTTIVANHNTVLLDNSTNDFVGVVSVVADRDITLADTNDIRFTNIQTSQNLRLISGGDISDASNTTIGVDGDVTFQAQNVMLGDTADDVVDFGRINASVTNRMEINEDSSVRLLNVSAESLIVRTNEGIFDGRTTTIDVSRTATFLGGKQVQIGDDDTDTFNAHSVNFKSDGHVNIEEDSSMFVTSSNTANTLILSSTDSIGDGRVASINVTGSAGFVSGGNVVLGESATDEFNARSIHFVTEGDFNLSEDSGIHIARIGNQSDRLILNSPSTITDEVTAQINVNDLASFTAESVNIGESIADVFNAGSVTFNTSNQFRIFENSNLNIVGDNTAHNVDIHALGDVSAIDPTVGQGTQMNVETVGAFAGANIRFGNQDGDEVNFGALRLNTPGFAVVSEDSSTLMTAASSIGELRLESTGEIQDSSISVLNVEGTAVLTGTTINLGDFANDVFHAQSLTLNATNDVTVVENSSMNLHGVNRAQNMTLVAAGFITDSMEANTVIYGLAQLSGSFINLGTETTDRFETGAINVNSLLNTNIHSDSDILLSGESNIGNQLLLRSTGSILDAADAKTEVANRAVLAATDVVIGDMAGDCFDILNGDGTDVIVASTGLQTINEGC